MSLFDSSRLPCDVCTDLGFGSHPLVEKGMTASAAKEIIYHFDSESQFMDLTQVQKRHQNIQESRTKRNKAIFDAVHGIGGAPGKSSGSIASVLEYNMVRLLVDHFRSEASLHKVYSLPTPSVLSGSGLLHPLMLTGLDGTAPALPAVPLPAAQQGTIIDRHIHVYLLFVISKQ